MLRLESKRQKSDEFSAPEWEPRSPKRVRFPEDLAAEVNSVLFDALGHTLTSASVRRVFDNVARRSLLNYDEDAIAFTYLYYAANFAKAYLATLKLLRPSREIPLTLLDLGAGSGASTAGVMCALYALGYSIAEVVIVDSSTTALNIFGCTTERYLKKRFPESKVDLVEADAIEYLRQRGHVINDVHVASYLRCELGRNQDEFDRLLARTTNNCNLVIAQLPERDGTFISSDSRSWEQLATAGLEVQLPASVQLPLPVAPKFASYVRDQQSDAIPRAIARYFAAWQQHDDAAIRRLFTDDAVYEIKRHRGTMVLNGVGEILAYWARNAQTQKNVRCDVKASAVSILDNQISFPWSAEFDRVDKERHYSLIGRMTIYLSRGRIARLSEQYSVEQGPVGRSVQK